MNWQKSITYMSRCRQVFVKKMGTTNNIFFLNNLIAHCINNSEGLYCAFVDFTKAFDFMVRDILWFKLIKRGIRGTMRNIIKLVYRSVKSGVKHNNLLSDPFECNIGVRQGECLSPFLFAMYVNDLESELLVNGISGIDIVIVILCILLYADDIVLFGKNSRRITKITFCFRRALCKIEVKG